MAHGRRFQGGLVANPTRSELIAQSLAAEIINGQLEAGYRLEEEAIASRFSVSRSPVRDALRHLALTYLVEYRSRRGFLVTPIDSLKLRDMYEALGEVEALCAGLCALRAEAAERSELEKLHVEAKAAAANQQAELYAALNDDLHGTIYAGAHNETLEGVATSLRRRLAPFRSRRFFERDRLEDAVAEHESIVAAIVGQDAERAASVMRTHTARTALNVLNRVQTARA
jgi:DNA-binding GntR family transcriptional regulator